MANITNRQAINFLVNKCRPVSDLVEKARRTAQQLAIDIPNEFEAFVSDNASEDVIADGSDSATDGRQIITKGDVLALKYVLEQMVATLTSFDFDTTVSKFSLDGRPIF